MRPQHASGRAGAVDAVPRAERHRRVGFGEPACGVWTREGDRLENRRAAGPLVACADNDADLPDRAHEREGHLQTARDLPRPKVGPAPVAARGAARSEGTPPEREWSRVA